MPEDHHSEDQGVRERLGDVAHAVHDAVAGRVGPAVGAVTSAFHGAGQAASHLRERWHPTEEASGPTPVPAGAQIVRPARGGVTFLAWRNGQWAPVHRVHGTGWVWSA